MRIISGKHKGRYITPPKNTFKARPTTDFAKESLFNIINNHFNYKDIIVLDLFSGTGSISYEFASRGCKTVYAVENNFSHYNFIKNTINKLDLKEIKVWKADVFKFLPKFNETFDIIFADPPYDLEITKLLPDMIFQYNLLIKNGWFILEHDKKLKFNAHPNYFDERIYGNVHFSFFN
ncbi:MAG: RsmD family RNA methyltransferase [Bacteroidales bacterium]|nr:RsmD family RNA methyltransferase [Bacteroidales bacterium]